MTCLRTNVFGYADNVPVIDRNFEAMLVWMDERRWTLTKSFFIKHTTNTGRTRIDSIKYKVDVNTMEHLSGKTVNSKDLPLQLNQIARVTFTTAKPLFFDSYQRIKLAVLFILIDPVPITPGGDDYRQSGSQRYAGMHGSSLL